MAVAYNSYWRTWSRVLQARDGVFIELNLTHINGDWSKVRGETIRKHSVERTQRDLVCPALPYASREAMVKILGSEFTTRLLTYNYLPEIDWVSFDNRDDGTGVPFNQVRLVKANV